MDIKIALQKIANEFVADKDYVHDPDHKNRPKGGNWKETENGWSTKDQKEKNKPDMKPDGYKTTPSWNDKENLLKWNNQKLKEFDKSSGYDPNQPAKKVKELGKPVTPEKVETAPVNEVSKPEPKLDDYMALINTPAIKSIKKRISVDPDRVINDVMSKTGKVKDAYKPHLIKLYKSWVAMKEGDTSPDMQAKVGKVKLAIQALRTPKFKKTTPRLNGGMKYLIKDNNIGADELQELAGFKESIKDHPRMSDKEYKNRIEQSMKLPRSEQQLKQAFVAHMNPTNYETIDAFNAAKQRVSKMNIQDFGKLLASLNNDEEIL